MMKGGIAAEALGPGDQLAGDAAAIHTPNYGMITFVRLIATLPLLESDLDEPISYTSQRFDCRLRLVGQPR